MNNELVLFDTLLRDGCQSADVNFSVNDKLEIIKALDDFGIDYIEAGWPAANEKDMQTFHEASKLKLKQAKIVAFGSTRRKGIPAEDDLNLQAIVKSHAPIACIFGKTWLDHITKQLKSTPNENLLAIADSIAFLKKENIEVFYDCEHFFDGFKDNKQYALQCIKTAAAAGASYIVPCDTNGGTLPQEVEMILQEVQAFLAKEKLHVGLGVHFHDDCGVGVANSLLAVDQSATMIQGTINGLGERTGNADLSQIIPNLMLKKKKRLPKIQIEKISSISNLVYTLANIKPNPKKPFVGKNAFSHKGGIHVDALNKGASYEHIDPSLVGNKRDIVLSDLSGRANILEVLKTYNIKADKEDPRVSSMLHDVELLEKKGYDIGSVPAEQYLLKEKHFGGKRRHIQVLDWQITSGRKESEYSEANIAASIHGKKVHSTVKVKGGPVDALFHALKELIDRYERKINTKLVNFKVAIAKDRGVESSVRVYIGFHEQGQAWGTVGISANILEASLEAIEKGFAYSLLKINS